MLRIALKLNVENRQKCVTQQEESNPWCHSIQKKISKITKKKMLKSMSQSTFDLTHRVSYTR